MRTASDFFQRLNIAGGSTFNGNETEERLLSADIDLSVEQESEFAFAVRDPGFLYLQSFGDKGPIDKDAEYEKMLLRCAAYTLEAGPGGDGQTTFKMRPRGVQRCRKITGALTRENISASQFVIDSAANCGMTAVTQETPVRPSITRDVAESETSKEDKNEWTTLQRLAGEEGFLLFELHNVLYFATPQWLFDKRPNHVVGYNDLTVKPEHRMIMPPSGSVSSVNKDNTEINFSLPIDAVGTIFPGNSLTIKGVPFIKEKLLISRIAYPLTGIGDLSVSAKKPWKIEKTSEKEKAKAGASGQTFGPGGTGSKDFYAKEIIAAAKERNLGKDGARNGIATALVETNLTMYANSKVPESLKYPHDAVGSDGTSCGLFQQQQNGAWGTLAQNMNARASAGLFFNAMTQFDWRAMAPGDACQRVQRSAFPEKYAQRMDEAMGYVNRLY